MSQSPFPVDAYAAARLDWCRSSRTPEGGAAAQLVCSNLARQCGSFTNATRDAGRIRHTAPLLQQLISAPEIQEWHGKCPVAEVTGVCGLGGAQRYRTELWQGLAAPREALLYEAIGGRRRPTLQGVAAEPGDEEAGPSPDKGGDDDDAPPAAHGLGAPRSIEIARELPGGPTFPDRASAYAAAARARRPLRSDQQLVGLPYL